MAGVRLSAIQEAWRGKNHIEQKGPSGDEMTVKLAAERSQAERAFAWLEAVGRLRSEPLFVSEWPRAETRMSLDGALTRGGGAERVATFQDATRSARASVQIAHCPIIGVLGGLNAGKSSVVAGFLSAAGRMRVPRGVEAKKGTHRFVYWVPKKWEQEFVDLVGAAHGRCDFLSMDSESAADQYRSGRDDAQSLNRPLIGSDSDLDELDAAFLDCPDIQTAVSGDDACGSENRRLEFVADAARLCSAFLLVWDRATVRDRLLIQVLTTIRSRMDSVPLYLLINKVCPKKGEPGNTCRDEDVLKVVRQFEVRATYVAFNFDVGPRDGEPGWKELTPPALVEGFERLSSTYGKDGRLPQFYEVALGAEDQLPSTIPESRFLKSLPRRLKPAELQRDRLRSNLREIRQRMTDDLAQARDWARDECARGERVHDGLLQFCQEQFTGPHGEPLQKLDKRDINDLRKSFERTAPWYFKPACWTARFTAEAKAKVAKIRSLVEAIRRMADHSARAAAVKGALREAGVGDAVINDAERLAQSMKVEPWVPVSITDSCLKSAWEVVLARHRECQCSPDKEALDEMTRTVWKNLPTGKKWLAAISSILAVLAALAALVDGGATAVAVYFPLANTLAASIWGTLFAAGGTTAAAVAAFSEKMTRLNTLPALSNFFALACDAFAVPRDVPGKPNTVDFGKKKYTLPEPTVAFNQDPECRLGHFGFWIVEETTRARIGAVLAEIEAILNEGRSRAS